MTKETMNRHFDTELSSLKEKILAMGGYVEKAVEEATKAILQRENGGLQRVAELERKINEYHIEIDEDCFELIARKAPLAADLRLILATVKINTDLERMGDQAINIAYNGQQFLTHTPFKLAPDFN